MNRLERLTQTQQEKDNAVVSHQVAQDELQLQADILETQRQVELKKQELETLKSNQTLQPSKIVACMDELEGYQKGLKALKKLKTELF